MRYAIAYVSTARDNMNKQEVTDLMKEASRYNEEKEITGLLLYNEINFFELLEGNKKVIEELFERIRKDSRHHSIIKFFDKQVYRPAFDGFMTDTINETNKFDKTALEGYLNHIDVLEPESQERIKKVIELMMI